MTTTPIPAAAVTWQRYQVVPGVVAADLALKPLEFSESPRIGFLGDSGTGKTEAARAIVREYLKKSVGVVLVLDDKHLRPRWGEGQERRDLADLAANPPEPEPRVYVLRGDVRAGVEVDPEKAAAWAWAMSARRKPTLVVYDELTKAAKNGRWKSKTSMLPKTFGQGREVGISTLWGTQSPQDVPREAFEQSSNVFCFRLDGLGLNVLEDRNYILSDELADVIRSLPGDDVEPAQRGYFVLLRRGRPWDQKIYRFAA